MHISQSIRRYILLLFIISLTISGCGDNGEQLTITANYEVAITQIVDTRASATIANARLQTTLDHVSTRVIEVEQQGLFMRSTLVAIGTDSAFIANNLPIPGSFPTFTPAPTSPVNAEIAPIALPEATIALDEQGTPIQTTPDATEAGNQPRLQDIVIASGVNANDCARGRNPVITPNSTEIYVVATAYAIPVGTDISSTWFSNGTEVARFSFTAQAPINGSCIWFFIDQSDTEFIVGSWSVELKINDQPTASPLPFQIIDNS
jgi:hypothetical protein